MAERALRGTRLGAISYENDRNTDLAPRQEVTYTCLGAIASPSLLPRKRKSR